MSSKQQYIIVYDWMSEITEHERLFGLIYSLCVLNKSTEVDISVAYIAERLHKTTRTIQNWIADMVEEGVIFVDVKRGRGVRNVFRLNTKGFSHFIDEKIRKVWEENTQENTKGFSDFSGLPRTPSMDNNVENKFNNKYNNSSFETSSQEDEDGEKKIDLFKEDEIWKNVSDEVKRRFAIFWQKFSASEEYKNRYKISLVEFNKLSEEWQNAAIKVVEKYGHWSEPNPYFYLQNFAPLFLDGRQQYKVYKAGGQLCRVKYHDEQPITTPDIARWFGLEILDAHFERGFEN